MEILFLFILIGVNGLFAMSEMALVSSRKPRLQARADRGNRGAKTALKLQEDSAEFLATVQIGITLVGVFAGAFGATAIADDLAVVLLAVFPSVEDHAETIALALVVVLTTYLSLVIGELVPKRIALAAPEPVAALVARPMRLLSLAAHPAVWFLRVSTNVVLRILGLHRVKQVAVTEEEIHSMLDEGATAGVIEPEEKKMMRGVMRLADRDLRSIMTPRRDLVWLDLNDPADSLMRKVAESGHSRLPVARGDLDHILGVVQTKDILARIALGGGLDLNAVMHPPVFVPETLRVMRFLEALRGSNVRMGLVVDERGALEGIVTAADLLGAIAGETAFSPEDRTASPVRRADGSWLIDGMTSVDDLPAILGRTLIIDGDLEGDFTTVGGLIMHALQRIASVGDRIERSGITFEVVDMDGRRIDKVLISSRVEQ